MCTGVRLRASNSLMHCSPRARAEEGKLQRTYSTEGREIARVLAAPDEYQDDLFAEESSDSDIGPLNDSLLSDTPDDVFVMPPRRPPGTARGAAPATGGAGPGQKDGGAAAPQAPADGSSPSAGGRRSTRLVVHKSTRARKKKKKRAAVSLYLKLVEKVQCARAHCLRSLPPLHGLTTTQHHRVPVPCQVWNRASAEGATDGLSLDAFVRFLSPLRQLTADALATLFHKIDANDDGTLTWDEYLVRVGCGLRLVRQRRWLGAGVPLARHYAPVELPCRCVVLRRRVSINQLKLPVRRRARHVARAGE